MLWASPFPFFPNIPLYAVPLPPLQRLQAVFADLPNPDIGTPCFAVLKGVSSLLCPPFLPPPPPESFVPAAKVRFTI